MIRRLYIHNFRCLQNFEMPIKDIQSCLIMGKNGSGKSTILSVLEILQGVGRGANRVGGLVGPKDFAYRRSDAPIRFEIEVFLDGIVYMYSIAFELPDRFKELRVFEEILKVDGQAVFTREAARVILHSGTRSKESQFYLDWHLIALPVIHEQSDTDPILRFKTWLGRMVLLSPNPRLMNGESSGETLEPMRDGSNLAEWFTGLLSHYPAAYPRIQNYLSQVMPDIQDFLNESIGRESKSMVVRFASDNERLSIAFDELSDGEKCFFLCAVLVAANEFYGPLFCFWDEPDNYLSISEIGHFIVSLRRSFSGSGQLFVTSHNTEAIQRFSNENTYVISRSSHLEPSRIKLLSELQVSGNLVDALIRGELDNGFQ